MQTESKSKPISEVAVPLTGGQPIVVTVASGTVVFLVGPNGCGKSALMHHFNVHLREKCIYLPGSRPSSFDSESLSMTAASRQQLGQNIHAWDKSPSSRWRLQSGTARNEKAVHDLQNAELTYNVDAAYDIKAHGASSTAIAKLQSKSSPIDKVNALLEQANLPVRLVIDHGELRVTRGDAVYSFAKMSDGERTALIFAAEVVSAPLGSVFLVDEPELHLHRSVTVPLLRQLIETRTDCAFVVSTHELALPGELPQARALLIRGCSWVNDAVVSWSVDDVANVDDLPESLRVDVLGARKKILFVEGLGGSKSLDHPLYALLFPSISVVSKETCKEVHRAVVGLRNTESQHRAQAFGMVDQDGMSDERVAQLQTDGVYALTMFAVESVYYSEPVLKAVADQQASTLGATAAALIADATKQALSSIGDNAVDHLASRVAQRRLLDALQFMVPDREAMIKAPSDRVAFEIASTFLQEQAAIRGWVNAGDLASIIRRYPVRESGILSAVAKGLRFLDRADFEKAALARIGASPELRQTIRDELGEVSKALA